MIGRHLLQRAKARSLSLSLSLSRLVSSLLDQTSLLSTQTGTPNCRFREVEETSRLEWLVKILSRASLCDTTAASPSRISRLANRWIVTDPPASQLPSDATESLSLIPSSCACTMPLFGFRNIFECTCLLSRWKALPPPGSRNVTRFPPFIRRWPCHELSSQQDWTFPSRD